MSIKILHTADLHLGCRQYGIEERELDFYKALKNIANVAIEQKVDGVIIAGDIFDVQRPTPVAVSQMQKFVEKCHENNIRVLGIEGNHDKTKSRHEWVEICGIERITADSPAIFNDDFSVVGIPYMGKPEDFIEELENIKHWNPGGVDVLVTHQGFLELGDPFSADMSIENMLDKFENLKIAYIANGHIHKKMSYIAKNDNYTLTVGQPGAIELKSTSEDPNKYVFIVSIDDSRSVSIEAVKINTRPVWFFDICSDDDLSQISKNNICDSLVFVKLAQSLDSGFEKVNHAIDISTEENNGKRPILRIIPIGESSETFDRTTAVKSLEEAIEIYFEKDSVEYNLVSALLASPDSVSDIAKEFIKNE